MSTLVCLGLGYCAAHYVAEFGERFSRIVGTTRRGGGIARPGVEEITFDGVTASPDLVAAVSGAEALLISAPPTSAGDPVLGALVDVIARATNLKSVVLLSTLGVYGDHAGAWIDETAECRPMSPRGRERLAAERAWEAVGARAGFAVAILRLAGIYGPGQNALVSVLHGHARRIVKPGQVFNRIHVEDIAQAIEACIAHRAGGVFNLSDDEPTPPADPILLACELLGRAPPPEERFEDAAATMSPMGLSFYAECKRARNAELKDVLGVRLRYPTYREGLHAERERMRPLG